MLIDWKLISDNEIIIEEHNKEAKFTDNILEYIDEYGTHIINLNEKTYARVTEDNTFKVDFINNILTITFLNQDLKYDIATSFLKDDNSITLTYSLGEENKTIIVTRGGIDEN